ncbi:MAG TPA: DUF1822 family protein [Crinalium sp.]|jgi:hypothetical protein
MTYSTQNTEDFALPLPITQQARQMAQQFANQQPTPQKADQVRLNTLAVAVVNDYLRLMGIDTDLSASDSWNPVMRLCADVADLQISEVGRLECRPLHPQGQTCPIPPEVWEDRVGYVVVGLDDALAEATLLGFVPAAATEELSINQLQSPEALLDHLDRLLHPVTQRIAQTAEQTLVNLGQWFQNLFESGWQTAESLLNSGEMTPAFGFRGVSTELEPRERQERSIRRAKLIDLGIQLAHHPVALVVELYPNSSGSVEVCLQVHPTVPQIYLPPELKLLVLDQSGTTFLEAQSRQADNYIQLLFNGTPGERFSVQVTLGNASVTENFVI